MLAGSDLDFPWRAFGPAPHRLIISQDAVVLPWQVENLSGWEIRRIRVEPFCRILISDEAVQYTELDEAYRHKGFYISEKLEADRVAQHFEKLWEESEPYEFSPDRVAAPRLSIPSRHSRWSQTIEEFATSPEKLRTLTPGDFEEFIAELLIFEGFDTQLTGKGKDGGRDILASSHGPSGTTLMIVECKRYLPPRKVDVRAIRGVFGTLEAERASKGMVVTTSSFTTPAIEFAHGLKNRISLRTFGDVAKWLRRITSILERQRVAERAFRPTDW